MTTGPATRFDLRTGPWRGTQISLHDTCLVHRGDSHLETLPLAALSSVQVSFQRDESRLRWGVVLIVLALLLFAIAGPIETLAASAGREIAAAGPQSGVATALAGLFRFLEALGRALPVIAVVTALAGAALAGLGWLGATVLTLSFAGGERRFPVRGRDALLLEFAERVAEALATVKR